jgi:hypothetical protein
MGYANAQRSLDYIRIIAEFISQPQYKDVVAIFGIINEPQGSTIGQEQLSALYVTKSYIYTKGVLISFSAATMKHIRLFVLQAELELVTVHIYLCMMDSSPGHPGTAIFLMPTA